MSTIVGNMGIGGPATILWSGHTLWLGPAIYSGHSDIPSQMRSSNPSDPTCTESLIR